MNGHNARNGSVSSHYDSYSGGGTLTQPSARTLLNGYRDSLNAGPYGSFSNEVSDLFIT